MAALRILGWGPSQEDDHIWGSIVSKKFKTLALATTQNTLVTTWQPLGKAYITVANL